MGLLLFVVLLTTVMLGNTSSDLDELQVGDVIGHSMVSEEELYEEAQAKHQSTNKRSIKLNEKKLWPDGIVPYEIETALEGCEDEKDCSWIKRVHPGPVLAAYCLLFKDDTEVKQCRKTCGYCLQYMILNSMDKFSNKTCIKFVKRTYEPNWVKFVNKTGCITYRGRLYSTEGPQEVHVGNCSHNQQVLRTLMILLGGMSELLRSDRDFSFNINPENIKKAQERNFYPTLKTNNKGPIDAYSVNIYQPNEFGKDNKSTYNFYGDPMNKFEVGPSNNLTQLDIIKINILYKCHAECSQPLGVKLRGPIPDESLSASSSYKYFTPSNGRLEGCTSWCSASTKPEKDYFQIDLGKPTYVCTVQMQGNDQLDAVVETFTMRYSDNTTTLWGTVIDPANGREKVFTTYARETSHITRNKLPSPVKARYVRLYPKKVRNRPCMRVELLGGEPQTRRIDWSPWTPCNVYTCKQERQRFCKSISRHKECPGADFDGSHRQTRTCSASCKVAIDGHWGRWSSWDKCKAQNSKKFACGYGTHKRKRKCDNPPKKNGGKECPGKDFEIGQCRDKICNMGPIGCSFTNGFCSWSHDPISYFEWSRVRGKDHTDGSGYYITFKRRDTGLNEFRLRSPIQLGSKLDRCLSFYYFSNNKDKGFLPNVTIEDAATAETVLVNNVRFNIPFQKTWTLKQMTIKYQNDYRIILTATNAKSSYGIDDINFTWGACDKNQTHINPTPDKQPSITETEETCNLDHGFCSIWKNAPKNKFVNFDWLLNKGPTRTEFTGPLGDHTSKIGKYAYIDTSPPRTFQQRAHLVSKYYTKEFKCLAFWYHMNGIDVFQLNVYKQTMNKKYWLFSTYFNTRNNWLKTTVNISGTEDFKIIIEGVVGPGEKGDIAIDDITVSRRSCYIIGQRSAYREFEPHFEERGVWQFYQSIFSCADLPGDFYWTPELKYKKQFRMYFNSTGKSRGEKALVACPVPKVSVKCVIFQDLMSGSGMGTLNVYQEGFSSANRTLMLSRTGDPGLHSVKLPLQKDIQQIVFEGIVHTPRKSDITFLVEYTPYTCN